MGYLKQAWLVLLLALGFGSALAGVHIGLSPQIAENKRNETYSQVPNLIPGAVKTETKEIAMTLGGQQKTVYRAHNAEGEHVGWVLPAKGQGFADVIELLIGLSPDASRLTGLYVLDQKETPGLGDKIRSDEQWRSQYEGMATAERIEVVKRTPQDQQIEAITGATVSSQAVTDIINKAVGQFRAAMGEWNQPEGEGGRN
ncbi:MAG: FMN-binding protein [Phycisphaerae bacterium]